MVWEAGSKDCFIGKKKNQQIESKKTWMSVRVAASLCTVICDTLQGFLSGVVEISPSNKALNASVCFTTPV